MISELAAWTIPLQRIAAQPLALCEDFPAIAQRWETWWAHDLLDRPVFVGTANTQPDRPIDRRLDVITHPDRWFDAKYADMLQTHRIGDALPHIRADFGPVLLGALLGGRIEFGADTTWTHAFIEDDWSNAPDWCLRDDNCWWLLLQELTQRVARDAVGRYLVCTPDLGGSGDVLLNLRGAAPLCMDVAEQPGRITTAVDAIFPAWRKAFTRLYKIALSQGAGLIHWLGAWSGVPYMIPACDFNFMIGPREFERLLLPDIARQAAAVGRGVFHLDGPGAARHIDALLEVPDIQAIQFTPGAGTPSALAWVEMFRKIQGHGRSVLAICPPDEALALSEALRPEGLAILLDRSPAPEALDGLFDQFCRPFGRTIGRN